jgi:pilus assembly protein CpaB
MNNKAFTMSLTMALLATFMIFSYIQSREEEWAKRYGDEVPVVIAKRDINELESIKESMIDVKNIPKDYRSPGYTTNRKEVVGFIALVPIREGEQITNNKIGPLGVRTGLARQVAPGKRAISLAINEVTGVSKLLKPGDRVDVIIVMDPPGSTGKGTQIAKTILQDVPILAVGKYVTSHVPRSEEKDETGKTIVKNLSEMTSYSTITLEVDPPSAQTMAYINGAGGVSVTLTLRNNDDTERLVLPVTTARDILGVEAAAAPRAPAAAR